MNKSQINYDTAHLFHDRYGFQPVLVSHAPGRVNLIGEHTDYNDGFVFPIAINRSICCAFGPDKPGSVRIYSKTFGSEYIYRSEEKPSSRGNWSDYPVGVLLEFKKVGISIEGCNCVIVGDVPLGAGLSSSAALEVSFALGCLAFSGEEMDRRDLALLCQRAENTFAGVKCGIMDQFISIFGKRGEALLIDCRSLEFRSIALPPGVDVVAVNSHVKHGLVDSEYNRRREECSAGVEFLRKSGVDTITALRDVSSEKLNKQISRMGTNVGKRCRHVVTENERVLEAEKAFKAGDSAWFGELMNQSQESMRDDYEISCQEIDILCEFAQRYPGVYGARLTGGGFGGCTVNLIEQTASEDFMKDILSFYRKKTGIEAEAYRFEASSGSDIEM